MSPDVRVDALAADLALLEGVLADVLAEQGGERLARAVATARAGDPGTAVTADLDLLTDVVRALGVHFHLANVAEQVHRVWQLADRDRGRSPLAAAADRIAAADLPRAEVQAAVARLAVRPVLTAHPTEATRRSVLSRLREIGGLLESRAGASAGARADADARLAEAVTLLWQTDELRRDRPPPIEEAETAIWYLTRLAGEAAPEAVERLAAELARIGVGLPPSARPVRFGTWAGGDRDGNPFVTAAVTLEVLGLLHDHALGMAEATLDGLARELSTSSRLAGASAELEARLAEGRAAFPEVEAAWVRRYGEEPYRMLCRQAAARVRATRERMAGGGGAGGYAGAPDLAADLALAGRSLREHGGARIADGPLARATRRVALAGFGLATLDVRDHSGRIQDAVGRLVDAAGEERQPYGSLGPGERARLLAAELGRRRPLTSAAAPPPGDGGDPLEAAHAVRRALDRHGDG
ncbi:MAG: phosphoenolpyruvate carboxylase, partial [Thermoleophilia bacterium]|nr:phosphoenolpyruvate carboxylase [Thermoleophilia bacterium]